MNIKMIDPGPLTPAESRVLELVCQGFYRKQIAARTHRTVSTVSTHVENIARKLDAHSSAEIVAKAVARGIVRISLVFMVFVIGVDAMMGLDLDQRRPPNMRLRVQTVRVRSRD